MVDIRKGQAPYRDRGILQYSVLQVLCRDRPIPFAEMKLFSEEKEFGVTMPEGTPGISRRHACIRYQQGMPMLIDLGSSYGTYLADGKQLPPNYPEPVAAGTRFYLGNRGNMFQVIVF